MNKAYNLGALLNKEIQSMEKKAFWQELFRAMGKGTVRGGQRLANVAAGSSNNTVSNALARLRAGKPGSSPSHNYENIGGTLAGGVGGLGLAAMSGVFDNDPGRSESHPYPVGHGASPAAYPF